MPRPPAGPGLRHGPLGPGCLHLCVDMQRLFGPGYPWAMAWFDQIMPRVAALVARNAGRTIFTRFIPPLDPEDLPGRWQPYYRKWPGVTRRHLPAEALDLAPPLAGFVPPARVVDKSVYSPWFRPDLDRMLEHGRVDTLLISGGETDQCVLATVLGAVDRGFRVVLVGDCLCSASDATHDALMQVYSERFDQQIEVAPLAEVLEGWPRA